MSMLRTSTEMGNLAGITGDLPGMGNMSRAQQQRGAPSRLSTASSLSNNSSRTSRHHRQWPSSSSAARRSITREPNVPQYVPDTLSPTIMNIPGSSSLVPMWRDRNSHRSLSMTHTMEPNFRLSSNRSLGSLRHEHIQRPRSPYHYPTRLRRPGYRPASPALSDMTGWHPPRQHGNSSQGQPYYPGQMKLRIPSDTSLGYQERAHRVPRRPSRGPSPVYYAGPRPDVPPIPPQFQHHIAGDQARMIHRSMKGSVSSGSTNLRTDSDTPSSDMASPPTPKDGASMEVLVSPNATQMIINTVTGVVKEDMSSGPLYYDYSEPFEHEHFTKQEGAPVSTGIVSHVKTSIEGRGPSFGPVAKTSRAPRVKLSEVVRSSLPDIAELPASPVPRRITRDLILKGIEPSSTTGVTEATINTPAFRNGSETGLPNSLPGGTNSLSEELAGASLSPDERNAKRHSILSQTGSSVLDSSTLDFAVRYSIHMATGAGYGTGLARQSGSEPASPASLGRSTEDGMSELLAGYQHTDSKQESDVLQQVEGTVKKARESEECIGRRSHHARRSSDEQSFKSCTVRPDPVSEPASPKSDQDQDAKSFKSATDILPEQKPSVKDSDARSVTISKVTATPDRVASMPPSRLPSASLVKVGPKHNRPVSEMPLSSPLPAVLRWQPPISSHESSLSVVSNKVRAGSKPSTTQGSMSISGSSSTLSVMQPPPVPPRESSSSKEAQRYQAVASFLVRQLPARFAKGRKSTKDARKPKTDADDRSMSESTHDTSNFSSVASSSQFQLDFIKTPEKVLSEPNLVHGGQIVPSVPSKGFNESKVVGARDSSISSHHDLNSATPVVQEPSSVYSPQDFSSRSRLQSSPIRVPKSPEHSRRDSQTTTHLVWHGGRRSLSMPLASTSEPQFSLPSVQEDTTTDLRLSGYRYLGPSRYLPDLKEESHEDSSLNTSASNLKGSHFRFPHVGAPGVRASGDDAIMFSRSSSTGSPQCTVQASALGQAHGLPSMQFSQMNLFEKLNEELGLRYSRSMGGLANELQVLKGGSPTQPGSISEVREKYRSLVAELDDELKKSGGSTQPTAVIDLITSKRAYSPEMLMTEIDQLSIPSVGGLTQRISELIPSLREYYKLGEQGEFVEEEMIMEHAMEEIHEVGGPAQKRSSARLRPVPGSPNMVVIDDALYEELTSTDKGSASPGRQGDSTVELGHGEVGSDAKKKGVSVTQAQVRQQVPLTEIKTPSPAFLRPRSHTVGQQEVRASVESGLSSRRSLRSFVSTPTATDTRPWNSDKNYPWATTTIPSIDISLPSPTAVRQSPRPGPSHLRNRLSNTSTTTSFSSADTATASPFGTVTGSHAHARQHHFSNLGRTGDQPHAAGERYPTSALTPPTAIFRDHTSSLDASDDEDFNTAQKGRLRLKKRFSSARNATLDNSTRTGRSKTNALELASPESTQQSTTSKLQDRAGEAQALNTNHRHTFRDAEGMPIGTYHRNKIIDHLKKWWHKGGSLIRQLSRRKQSSSSTV
ncbi:Nn.00g052150.m01.CDS01 [Neocucurbitaria sp. VM-36]